MNRLNQTININFNNTGGGKLFQKFYWRISNRLYWKLHERLNDRL